MVVPGVPLGALGDILNVLGVSRAITRRPEGTLEHPREPPGVPLGAAGGLLGRPGRYLGGSSIYLSIYLSIDFSLVALILSKAIPVKVTRILDFFPTLNIGFLLGVFGVLGGSLWASFGG